MNLKKWFISIGIQENQVTECDWWDEHEVTCIPESINIKDEAKVNDALTSSSNRKLTIAAVPCQHFSGRSLSDRNETLWNGWVVKSPDASYFFAGYLYKFYMNELYNYNLISFNIKLLKYLIKYYFME